jgi:diguanylate cyclase (GGDEF)-like protein
MEDLLRILVVDDDESLRGILASVLEDEGHIVTTAKSGEEALEQYLADPFPLIITDIRMGGMSGIELLRRLKNINPETEVIVITSYASVDTALTALRYGAYDYLVKPFEELDLITNVVGRATEKIGLICENKALLENLIRNRAELEEKNRLLQQLTVRDSLTGLFNRRYLKEMLAREVSRARRRKESFSVVFLDIDGFKNFNDRHGHPEGDAVLKTLSALLLERLRKIDIISRYGGEEFLLLLPTTSKESGIFCAETVRSLIEGHEFLGTKGQSLGRVTVSVGIAAFPADGDTGEYVVRQADAALYSAKNSGRNRVCAIAGGGV